jgi:HlyD family secretion protein
VEAANRHEIVVRPDEWSAAGGWVVREVVPHGARVKKGDLLVAFEAIKIDRAIEDLKNELALAQLSLRQAEHQLEALEESTPLDLEASQRVARVAQEDHDHYFEKQRPFNVRQTEFSLRAAKNSLEYAEEELAQLKKMYEADELIEETEAIVLKRAQNSVEAARMSVEGARMRHDLALGYSHAREDERVRETSLRRRLDTQRAEITLPLALERQRLEVAKLNRQHAQSQEKLQKLEADRELLTIRSPVDGVVYYGRSVRGKFSDANTIGENLRPHGSVQPNQVFMTVVQPRPVSIRATVPEDKLYRLRVGLTGTAIPKAYPNLRLPVVVGDVNQVPLAPGSFEAQAKVTRSRDADAVMPGMACSLRFEPYVKHDALIVPPKALMTDPNDPDQHYVYVPGRRDRPTRRNITVGEKNDKQVEVLRGLSEGDRVLLEAPKP